MNPHQQNKVDISSLSPEEQRLFRLYGKLPNKKDLLQNKLKERKYFDSGDYALSKAGKASDIGVTSVGTSHPLPENIPHSNLSHSTFPQHYNNSTLPPGQGGIPALSHLHGNNGGGPVSGNRGGSAKESHLQIETSMNEVETPEARMGGTGGI